MAKKKKYYSKKTSLEKSQIMHAELEAKHNKVMNNPKVPYSVHKKAAIRMKYHEDVLQKQYVEKRILRKPEREKIYKKVSGRIGKKKRR